MQLLKVRAAEPVCGVGLFVAFAVPGRFLLQHFFVDRAGFDVGAGQVAGTHEEFAHDLSSGEYKGFLEELLPILLWVCGVVHLQPLLKGAMFFLQGTDAARVLDGGIYLEAVADNAFIGEQACDLFISIACYFFDAEVVECLEEVFPFFGGW